MQIKSYETSRGDNPVYDFIENLDIKSGSKIIKWINRLKEYGVQQLIKDGKCEKFKGRKDVRNIYELKIDYNGIFYRTFFTIIENNYWLLHSFEKKTNKTPQKELSIAISRYKELLLKLEN